MTDKSILAKVANTYGLNPRGLADTLAATIFPNKSSATAEQVQALLIVADQYGLNPFTREVYAFPNKGGVVPIVSVDGWLKLANNHPQFDGMEHEYHDAENGTPISCTAKVYRKDRKYPITATEYFAENKRNTDPWKNSPHRMIRHRAVIQAIRMAFSFSGIYEPDEGERIIEAEVVTKDAADPLQALAAKSEEAAPAEPAEEPGELVGGGHVQEGGGPVQNTTKAEAEVTADDWMNLGGE